MVNKKKTTKKKKTRNKKKMLCVSLQYYLSFFFSIQCLIVCVCVVCPTIHYHTFFVFTQVFFSSTNKMIYSTNSRIQLSLNWKFFIYCTGCDLFVVFSVLFIHIQNLWQHGTFSLSLSSPSFIQLDTQKEIGSQSNY